MRIVAGSARGRRIAAPAGTDTRPTSDRVREAMFNALTSMGVIADAVVVDLFAGSGALGLEALSRGAAQVTFVERDRRAVHIIEANIATLGFADRSVVVGGDAMANFARFGDADLVLCDPPYDFERWDELLAATSAATVVIESDREVDCPHGWELVRQKRYGTTVVSILTPSGASPTLAPPE